MLDLTIHIIGNDWVDLRNALTEIDGNLARRCFIGQRSEEDAGSYTFAFAVEGGVEEKEWEEEGV